MMILESVGFFWIYTLARQELVLSWGTMISFSLPKVIAKFQECQAFFMFFWHGGYVLSEQFRKDWIRFSMSMGKGEEKSK
jgi:hypothetical protein